MKLDVLHIDELRSRVIGEGVAVAGAVPTIARYFVSFADASGGKDDSLGSKNPETAALAIVAKRSAHPVSIL
jgi:hypothetical protein